MRLARLVEIELDPAIAGAGQPARAPWWWAAVLGLGTSVWALAAIGWLMCWWRG